MVFDLSRITFGLTLSFAAKFDLIFTLGLRFHWLPSFDFTFALGLRVLLLPIFVLFHGHGPILLFIFQFQFPMFNARECQLLD